MVPSFYNYYLIVIAEVHSMQKQLCEINWYVSQCCGSRHFEMDPDPVFHFDTDSDHAFHFETDPDQTTGYGSGSLLFQSGHVPKTVLL
jgi:hypothetical protein